MWPSSLRRREGALLAAAALVLLLRLHIHTQLDGSLSDQAPPQALQAKTGVRADQVRWPEADDASKPLLRLAYCTFPQERRPDVGNREAEWVAREIAPGFRARHRVSLEACAPDDSFVANKDTLGADELLERVGMRADVRVCFFGTSRVMTMLKEMLGAREVVQRVPEHLARTWTHGGRVFWPQFLHFVGDMEGNRVGPILVRRSTEPWMQYAAGVEVQLETKREASALSNRGVSVYSPWIVSSAASLLKPLAHNAWPQHGKRHGCCLPDTGTLRAMTTRPPDFDADVALGRKIGFASFLHSHCFSELRSTAVRQAFIFALTAAYKPVSPVGACPKSAMADARLGLTRVGRKQLQHKYRGRSATEVHGDFRFAIVFENGPADGYLTEKLRDAYWAQSIPVYFGAGAKTVDTELNPAAFVHCDLPFALTNNSRLSRLYDELAKSSNRVVAANAADDADATARYSRDAVLEKRLEDMLQEDLAPHFAACIRRIQELDANPSLYKQMLSEPLVPRGRLTGIWNLTLLGETLGAVRDEILSWPVDEAGNRKPQRHSPPWPARSPICPPALAST